MFELESSIFYKLIFKKLWSDIRMTRALANFLNNKIASGFARGMVYNTKSYWGNVMNKLTGTYEKELLPFLTRFDDRPPMMLFDIGAAEGYYAIGSLVRWPETKVQAWEANKESREILFDHARINEVSDRLVINKSCSESNLYQAVQQYKPRLILMDIEGEEINVISDRLVASPIVYWIVECHSDYILETLLNKFNNEYDVEVIENRHISFNDVEISIPYYLRSNIIDRFRLVNEGRPFKTPWLIASRY